jgi:CBS-domain-containing membrane protein
MATTPIVRGVMKKASRTFRVDEEMAPCMSILARSSFAAIPVVAGGPVGNYMSPLEVMVTPDMDLLTAARAFLACNFACLPVLENDRLVGRVTRHDVLKGMEKWATAINKERAGRLTQTSPHERPSAMEEIQKVAASHSREQMSQIFRRH